MVSSPSIGRWGDVAHFEEIEADTLQQGDMCAILSHIDRGDTLHLGDLLNNHGAGWAAPYQRS